VQKRGSIAAAILVLISYYLLLILRSVHACNLVSTLFFICMP